MEGEGCGGSGFGSQCDLLAVSLPLSVSQLLVVCIREIYFNECYVPLC